MKFVRIPNELESKFGYLVTGPGGEYMGIRIPEGFEVRTCGDYMVYIYKGAKSIGQYFLDVSTKEVVVNAMRREIETWLKRGEEGA